MKRILNLMLAVLSGSLCLATIEAQEVASAEFEFINEAGGLDAVDEIADGKSPDCSGPAWLFRGGALLMQRGTPDASVLIFDTADPANAMNADDFNFDFEAGWEVSAIRDGAERGWEIRFMSIDAWEAASALTAAPAMTFQVNTTPPSFLPGTTMVDATYRSDLLGGELNRRWRYTDRVTLLAGFRYWELDEHFRVDANTAVLPTSYDVFTANRLYGAQLGVDARLLCRNRLTVEGIGKVGVYYNDSGQSSTQDTGAVGFRAAEAKGRAAFAAELGVVGLYCLTECLSLRASYNLMYFDSVALASDRIPVTNTVLGTGISHDDVFYHGAMVGLEFRR